MATVRPTRAEILAGLTLPTGELHTIVIEQTKVDVQILDSEANPVANLLCVLTGADGLSRSQYTDADGWIHVDVSPARGELRLNIPDLDLATATGTAPSA
jgi:hypothetical protein